MESVRKHPLVNFSEFTHDLRGAIDRFMREALIAEACVGRLDEALSYSVLAPGKRFRPLLTLSLAHDFGAGNLERFLPVAAALEYMHVASLIHDDLPALDNDDIRRGKASCHRAFDEATAILAGDYLVPLALKSIAKSDFSSGIKARMITVACQSFLHLCNGQEIDVLRERASFEADIENIARLKTGALFAACFQLAALGVDSPRCENEIFEQTGIALGLVFQNADDLTDLREVNRENGEATLANATLEMLRHSNERLQGMISKLENFILGQGREGLLFTRALINEAIPALRFVNH